LFDCQVDPQQLEEVLAEFAPNFVGISCRNVDDIQFSSRETYFDAPVAFTNTVRARTRCPVILGGSAFSLYPHQLLELTGADYGIQGEGEVALVRLLAALENGAAPTAVPGLVYRDGARVVINPRQPMPPEEIHAPERAPRLAEYYTRRSSMLNIQTQRGCPLLCCYCTYPLIEGRIPRRRDPEAVAEELATLQRQGVKHVFIADSVFNTSAEHAAGVCEAILRRGVRVQWSCFLRPQNINAALMALMARAGLTHIEFGSDSFCEAVLKEYGKSFTFDEIHQASELAHAARVHYSHFLICGGPGETRETLQTTFENSRRLPGAVIFGLAGMRVYPGTPLLERARREGQIAPDADLLRPVYYLSPALGETVLLEMLDEFKRQAPNWIIGRLPPFFSQLAERFRQRGVTGPLWEYFQILQRMT
jgi:radical SAM superfamily enzyme YgiQ (UPF0313 family)